MIDDFDTRNPSSLDGQGAWVINEFGDLGIDAFEDATDSTAAANQVMVAVETAGNATDVKDGFYQLESRLEDGTTGTLFFAFAPTTPDAKTAEKLRLIDKQHFIRREQCVHVLLP